MSHVSSLYHIVFRTKSGKYTIPNIQSEKLYRYIWGFVKQKKCKLYRVNGMPDHIHLLINLHASISLADFVKNLKTSTNHWLKENKEFFPQFKSWARKYCALSCSTKDIEIIVNYIKNQREHHKTKQESSLDEIKRLLDEHNLTMDNKYIDEW